LDFEFNKQEVLFLSPSIIEKIEQKINPRPFLMFKSPEIIDCRSDQDGNAHLQIKVAAPYNELFIKEILIQYVQANLVTLEEATNIFESVCEILNREFKPINPAEFVLIEADIDRDIKLSLSSMLLEGAIKSFLQDIPRSPEMIAAICSKLETLTCLPGWKAYQKGTVFLLENTDVESVKIAIAKLSKLNCMDVSSMRHTITKIPVIKCSEIKFDLLMAVPVPEAGALPPCSSSY
jgi:hypothetical protein